MNRQTSPMALNVIRTESLSSILLDLRTILATRLPRTASDTPIIANTRATIIDGICILLTKFCPKVWKTLSIVFINSLPKSETTLTKSH